MNSRRPHMRRRVPFNPCDYLFLSHDRLMQSRGNVGNVTLMVMDVQGPIDPQRLRRALGRLLAVHPVAGATLGHSLLGGRPHWRVRRPGAVSSIPGEPLHPDALTATDLTADPNWAATADALIERRYAEPTDVRRGPLIRLDYYAGPGGSGKVSIRWPHALMDAEGTQWCLSELARLDHQNESAPLPPGLLPDHESLDVLAGRSLIERLAMFRKGFTAHRVHGDVSRTSLGRGDGRSASGLRLRVRVFEAADVARIQANAKQVCPAGPGIYARYMAGCVIRAVHSLYRERGIDTPSYLVTLPMSARPPGPRPMTGNYLVSATLCGRRELVDDPRALARDLLEQVNRFHAEGMPEAHWAMIWWAGLLRAWQYRLLLQLPFGLEPYASGFSYYGEIDPPIRRFIGAEVTNLWGATPLHAPPGINPAFAKFGTRLNFTLTWIKDYIADDTAEAFARQVEREALVGSGSDSSGVAKP